MTMTADISELIYLDPGKLVADANIRGDLGDLEGLTASVAAVGVLEPVIVAPNGDGRFHVVAGFRRIAAAAAAGCQVPCVVRPDLAAGGRNVLAQLAENLRRQDLTAAEEAAGYEQLRVFGLDEAAIAAQVGTAPEVVAKGLGLAKAPKAMAVSAKYFLSLDDSAAIAEFEDDTEAIKALTVTLQKDPMLFKHVLSRARQDRAHREKRAEIVRDLGDVPLVKKAPSYYSGVSAGRSAFLDLVHDDKGKAITPAKHKKCPGHAAWVEDGYDGPKLRWVCTDPVANGHKDRYKHGGSSSGSSRSAAAEENPEAKEKASKERKLVLANNKAWRAADPVRKAWLEELYLRAEPPKGALRYAVTAMLGNTRLLTDHGEPLRGQDLTKALDVADAKLPVLLMRLVCKAMERSMTVDTWRRPPVGTAAYLTFLGSTGYPLSEVENVAIAAKEASYGY